MVDVILLVPGVPVVLFVMLLALGRFEAAVAPDLEAGEQPADQAGSQRVVAEAGREVVEAAVAEDVEHSSAA